MLRCSGRWNVVGQTMQGTRVTGLALLVSVVFTAAGCYYRVQHYGYSREIGIGKVGCEVAHPMNSRPSDAKALAPPTPPEQLVYVTPLPAETVPSVSATPDSIIPVAAEQPSHLQAAGPAAAPLAGAQPKSVEQPPGRKPSDALTPLTSFLPKLRAPTLGPTRGKTTPRPAPPPEKGWVGLPAF